MAVEGGLKRETGRGIRAEEGQERQNKYRPIKTLQTETDGTADQVNNLMILWNTHQQA
jgi:hypothetical protein